MTSRLVSRSWLLLPVLLALVLYWPTLQHGFRSDDYFVVYYLDRDSGAVRWDRVLEEFVRPWFGVRDMYRPLISVTYALNLAVSAQPFGFHCLNLLFLAGTAVCTAAVVARYASQLPRLAGILAGALVVVHPASVETTAWIAARVTGQETFFAALACLAFVRHLHGEAPRWHAVAAAALALLSKEGAVMLPVSLLALDFLHRPARDGRSRWRLHWPVAALLLLYLGWRKLLLGVFTTAETGHALAERAGNLLVRSGQLLVPADPDGQRLAWAIGPLLVVAAALVLRQPRRAAVLLGWAVLLLLPTSHMAATGARFDGRLVFDSVPVLAFMVAMAVGGAPARRWLSWTAGVGAAALLVVLATGSGRWLRHYGEGDRTVHEVQRQLLDAGAASRPGLPFGFAGLPALPLLQTKLWGLLGLRPFAAADQVVVGMPELLARDDAAPALFGDAAPVHALVAAGGGAGFWHGASGRLVRFGAAAQPRTALHQDPADGSRFVAAEPLPAAAMAVVQVELPVAARSVRLRLLDDLQGGFEFGERLLEAAAPQTKWQLDTTRALAPWVFESLGGRCRGCSLLVDGAAPPPGTEVAVLASLPTDAVTAPLQGRVLLRGELAGHLRPPRADLPLRLYLLLPTGLLSVDVPAGGALAFPPAVQGQVDFAVDILGRCLVHWFWQTVPAHQGAPWRSGFDCCEVRGA